MNTSPRPRLTGSLLVVIVMTGCVSMSPESMNELDQDIDGSLRWIGDVHLRRSDHWVPNDQVLAGAPLAVHVDTYPAGAATSATLFWSDPDAGVRSAAMIAIRDDSGSYGSNTQWRAELPAAELVSGRALSYWIRAEDLSGTVLWDSHGGLNHELTPADQITLAFDPGKTWRFAGAGTFDVSGDVATAAPGAGLGLGWWAVPTPPNFELELEWRLDSLDDNSGVFVRFPDPDAGGYENPAWIGVHHGYEIQIDERARPDGAPHHRTGAIYEAPDQLLEQTPALPPGAWNRFTIRVEGTSYTVHLNGSQVARWIDPGDPQAPERGRPSTPLVPRFVGLQTHTGRPSFRSAVLRRLP